MLALPYLAYITVDLNQADWAASVAQLAEHWTSNPVVTGSNPVRGSSVFFFHCLSSDFALLNFPCFNAYTCMRLIMYMCSCKLFFYVYMYAKYRDAYTFLLVADTHTAAELHAEIQCISCLSWCWLAYLPPLSSLSL